MSLAAIGIGFVAGAIAGMFGVGGGVVFVPALVILLGLSQVDAEATSPLRSSARIARAGTGTCACATGSWSGRWPCRSPAWGW